jgi:poly(A) polymerase
MHPFHLCNVQREDGLSKKAALKLCRRAGTALTGLFLVAMSDSLASKGEKKPEGMEEELLILFNTVRKMYDETLATVIHGPRLLSGKDLIREGNLSPGPLFTEIFDELESARVEGKVVDRKTALAWVKEYLQEKKRRGELG